MDNAAALAEAIKSTEGMLPRYLEGFDDGFGVDQGRPLELDPVGCHHREQQLSALCLRAGCFGAELQRRRADPLPPQ